MLFTSDVTHHALMSMGVPLGIPLIVVQAHSEKCSQLNGLLWLEMSQLNYYDNC